MPKRIGRGRRGTARRVRRARGPDRLVRHGTDRIEPDVRDERGLLDRMLGTPQIAHVVPGLRPEVLHRVIQACGLEDSAQLVALATPRQLARVFDLDLWRPAGPAQDEQLDADRFATWVEVLMASGVSAAAQKLAGIDVDLVIAALAAHLRVFDVAAISDLPSDGAEVPSQRSADKGLTREIANYLVRARRTDAWDTIVALLLGLDAEHPDYFHLVMRGCRKLSNSRPEIDGLDDLLTGREQDLFDLEVDREQRREKQGYVTPAQARAFLESARQLRLEHDAPPPASLFTRAYFRAIESTVEAEAITNPGSRLLPAASGSPAPGPESPDAIAAVAALLVEAGVLPKQPRALLKAPQDVPRPAQIQAYLQFAREIDEGAYSMRMEEFAYLANTIVAGCSVQGRPFTQREAADAALAICNLGLENWPAAWLPGRDPVPAVEPAALPGAFLARHDLVSVFQVGWTILYRDVCMDSAARLIGILTDLRLDDTETQRGLGALRLDMTRQWRAGTPWRARDALDVVAILDMPTWAALLGLIDECPVIHAGLTASLDSRARTVSPSAFDFISQNRQIAAVRRFMRILPGLLRQG